MDLENTSKYRVSCPITDLQYQALQRQDSRICTFKSLPTVSIQRIVEHKCNFIRIRKYPACIVVKPTGKFDVSIEEKYKSYGENFKNYTNYIITIEIETENEKICSLC